MNHHQNRLSTVALAILALSTGCALQHAPEAGSEGRVFGQATELKSGAEFDVEVRFAGGATRAEAEELLANLEVVSARELFPGVDLSRAPDGSYDEAEALDASEPTFEVMLHPRNEAAEKERFAWRASAKLERVTGAADATEGSPEVAATQQALTLSGSIHKFLDPGETWRTARMRCYAPFVFGAEVLGLANVCIDLGYDGVAGSVCNGAVNGPVTVAHPGPDLNPLNKHYFRGRVTARLFSISAPAEILAAGWACL